MSVYLKNNKIFDEFTKREIQHPTIIVDVNENDPRSSIILKYGEEVDIINTYAAAQKAYAKSGLNYLFNTQKIVNFNPTEVITKEEIVYIIKRMFAYTATNFINDFIEHMDNSDFPKWIKAEMKKVPIDL